MEYAGEEGNEHVNNRRTYSSVELRRDDVWSRIRNGLI